MSKNDEDDFRDEERQDWLAHPFTSKERKVYTIARNVWALNLRSYARQSTDPQVRMAAAALEARDEMVESLGGQTYAEMFPVPRKDKKES